MRVIRTASVVALLLAAAGWHVAAEDKVFFMELPRGVLQYQSAEPRLPLPATTTAVEVCIGCPHRAIRGSEE
jgi:hypothetical protein